MTKKEKLVLKFKNNPISLKYIEIENLLQELWFEKINAKWSHIKFKHKKLNNDCKDFYKKQLQKTLIFYSLI